QRRWSAFGSWIATTLSIVATSVALVGSEGVKTYLALVTSDGLRDGVAQLNWKMESLVALARSILGGPLAFLDAPATAAIALAVLAVFAHRAYRPSRDPRKFLLLYGLAVIGGVLASPYLFVYDCT